MRLGNFLSGIGEAAEPGIRSLASSCVAPSQHASLFFTLAFLEMVGRVVGGPLMVFLLSIGRHSDGQPTGVLYLFSGVSYIIPI